MQLLISFRNSEALPDESPALRRDRSGKGRLQYAMLILLLGPFRTTRRIWAAARVNSIRKGTRRSVGSKGFDVQEYGTVITQGFQTCKTPIENPRVDPIYLLFSMFGHPTVS